MPLSRSSIPRGIRWQHLWGEMETLALKTAGHPCFPTLAILFFSFLFLMFFLRFNLRHGQVHKCLTWKSTRMMTLWSGSRTCPAPGSCLDFPADAPLPQGNHCPDLYHYRWVLPGSELRINGITEGVHPSILLLLWRGAGVTPFHGKVVVSGSIFLCCSKIHITHDLF